MNNVLVHINYFEQGQTLDRACRMVRELGAGGIEFRRKPGGFNGSDLDYLDEVAAAVDRNSIEWISFGAPGVDMMLGNAARREQELDEAEAFYRKAAARFPLRIVNAFTGTLRNPDLSLPGHIYRHHGSAIATDEQWEWAIQGYQRLGALAGELNFRFAFETHGCYLHDTIEASVRLVEGIGSPHVGVLWDQANLMLFPTSPSVPEAVKGMGRHLFYVHLKNLLLPPLQLLAVSSLSGGIINVREQLAELKKSGYTGPLCIEAPRAGDREQFLREDLAYLRSLLEEVE